MQTYGVEMGDFIYPALVTFFGMAGLSFVVAAFVFLFVNATRWKAQLEESRDQKKQLTVLTSSVAQFRRQAEDPTTTLIKISMRPPTPPRQEQCDCFIDLTGDHPRYLRRNYQEGVPDSWVSCTIGTNRQGMAVVASDTLVFIRVLNQEGVGRIINLCDQLGTEAGGPITYAMIPSEAREWMEALEPNDLDAILDFYELDQNQPTQPETQRRVRRRAVDLGEETG